VSVEILDRVVAKLVLPVAGRRHDGHAAGPMELVELVDVADDEVDGSDFG
jgi:hypothetical protein